MCQIETNPLASQVKRGTCLNQNYRVTIFFIIGKAMRTSHLWFSTVTNMTMLKFNFTVLFILAQSKSKQLEILLCSQHVGEKLALHRVVDELVARDLAISVTVD